MQGIRNFWNSGLLGKIVLIAASGMSVFGVCCVALAVLGLAVAPKPITSNVPSPVISTIEAIADVATTAPEPTAALEPTAAPTAAPTEAPSATLEPTAIPTEPPTAVPQPTEPPPSPTDVPRLAPTTKPTATAKPALAIATSAPAETIARPTAKPANAPIPTAVDVGAAPCQPGQIKGNRNSKIYHMPGQRDYARTYANVECFNTEAEAIAAGYRKAKR
jgi:hypothetical protein